jgi:hypothetical protein
MGSASDVGWFAPDLNDARARHPTDLQIDARGD